MPQVVDADYCESPSSVNLFERLVSLVAEFLGLTDKISEFF